jgi:hypothetical protein
MNAFKKFRDRAEKFKSSKDISNDKKIEDLNKIVSHDVEVLDTNQRGIELEEFIQQKAQALQKKGEIFSHRPKSEEVAQAPDLSKIPLWRGRRRDGMPLDYLKTHYGQWLSAFGAEQNNVFQDQIRSHDPGLIKGIHNQFREEGRGHKLHDFVKTRSARVDRELESINSAYLKKAERLSAAIRRRQDRA